LFIRRDAPDYVRSDNGPELTAKRVKDWLERVDVKTLFIEPNSPWENGYVDSFNGKLRDELLDGEIFDTLLEAKVLIERWRGEYNTIRPAQCVGVQVSGTGSNSAMEVHPRYARLDFHSREDRKTNLTTGSILGGRSLGTPADGETIA
jgi:transposase InsO family protein